MEQDKTKLLSDLYAIRATMSVVADGDYKVMPEREAIERLAAEQEQNYRNFLDVKEKFGDTFYKERENVRKRMNNLCRECETEKNLREFKEQRLKGPLSVYLWDILWKHRKSGCLWGVVLVIMIIACIVISFTIAPVWQDILATDSYWIGVLISSAICLFGFSIFFRGICIPLAAHEKNLTKKRLSDLAWKFRRMKSISMI